LNEKICKSLNETWSSTIKIDDETNGPPISADVTEITPAIHYTMGGALINQRAQIIHVDEVGSFDSLVSRETRFVEQYSIILKTSKQELPIPGLYGAGEVTGGVHGANRLGGNSLLECVVYGRIAGTRDFESRWKRARTNLTKHRQDGGRGGKDRKAVMVVTIKSVALGSLI